MCTFSILNTELKQSKISSKCADTGLSCENRSQDDLKGTTFLSVNYFIHNLQRGSKCKSVILHLAGNALQVQTLLVNWARS
jgi:hypothetical protein